MGSGRIAIFGGRGMLGTDLAAEVCRRGYAVSAYDLPEFDVTDRRQVADALAGVDAAINCAAYTNVDGAETNAEWAHRVNGQAVGDMGVLAREAGVWVLHFSTDFVFDGALDRPYVESDTPNPINEYGRSKLAGERAFAESGCSGSVVRLEWTYGTHGNNFVSKLIGRAAGGETARVVDDQVGSPTATTEVARMACDLLGQRAEGLFHFAAGGHVSRFEIARFIFEQRGLTNELLPCRTADYVTPAQRPLNSRFDCTKIQGLLSEPIEPWQEPLTRFLRTL